MDHIWNTEKKLTEPPKEELKFTSGISLPGAMNQECGHIWFYKDVNASSAAELNVALHKAAVEQRTTQIQQGLEQPSPIHLHIHSYGGSVLAGLSIADAIIKCPVPVHTYIEGGAASAATLISVAGGKRYIGPHAFLLIHQISSIHWGTFENFKDEMKNLQAMMETVRGFYRSRTTMPDRQIRDILKHDLWLPASKALKYGLVDQIL